MKYVSTGRKFNWQPPTDVVRVRCRDLDSERVTDIVQVSPGRFWCMLPDNEPSDHGYVHALGAWYWGQVEAFEGPFAEIVEVAPEDEVLGPVVTVTKDETFTVIVNGTQLSLTRDKAEFLTYDLQKLLDWE